MLRAHEHRFYRMCPAHGPGICRIDISRRRGRHVLSRLLARGMAELVCSRPGRLGELILWLSAGHPGCRRCWRCVLLLGRCGCLRQSKGAGKQERRYHKAGAGGKIDRHKLLSNTRPVAGDPRDCERYKPPGLRYTATNTRPPLTALDTTKWVLPKFVMPQLSTLQGLGY